MSGTRHAATAFTMASSYFHLKSEFGMPRTASGFPSANRDPGTGGEYLHKEPISIEVVRHKRRPR
jgi:hypothetical protein